MKTACKRMITQQVSEILRIEIEDGDLYPGTKIPTDTELAEMFGVQKQMRSVNAFRFDSFYHNLSVDVITYWSNICSLSS